MVTEINYPPATNPENKYDDGIRPRLFAWATEDDYGVDLIGRGVFVGYHTCVEGSVQKQHRDMIGERDGLVMLDGGGHAWFHEMDHRKWERHDSDFDKWIGTRHKRLLRPQHEVEMQV